MATTANFLAGSASFLPAATTNYSSSSSSPAAHGSHPRLLSTPSTPRRRTMWTAGISTIIGGIYSGDSLFSPADARGGRRGSLTLACAAENTAPGAGGGGSGSAGAGSGGVKKGGSSAVPNSNYVVPLDKAASGITRPLGEILRDLNKRVPDSIIKHDDNSIPWYHANRMLSFYAPGWCGEIRNIIFSDNKSVTVVYRVTVRGSDGEAHRESTGTVSCTEGLIEDPVAAAEEMAFCRACARFGFGLYLYHEDEML